MHTGSRFYYSNVYLWIGFEAKPFSDISLTLQQDTIKGTKWSRATEMTEEQALWEQQRMFVEACARMNGCFQST